MAKTAKTKVTAPAGADESAIATADIARIVVTTADRSIKVRRRAGLAFGPAETSVDPEALGEDQLKALCADPALKVELVLANGERFRLTRFPPDEADAEALLELSAKPAAMDAASD